MNKREDKHFVNRKLAWQNSEVKLCAVFVCWEVNATLKLRRAERERFESLNENKKKNEWRKPLVLLFGAPGRILNLSFAPALWAREVYHTRKVHSYRKAVREV